MSAAPSPRDPEDEGHRQPIRDAATVVLIRRDGDEPRVLMGQRGAGAAFMPNKFVFPGGAVDPGDAGAPLAAPLDPALRARLAALPVTAAPPPPEAMIAAAVRELWEEAGLMLSRPGAWPDPATDAAHAVPADWQVFAQRGQRPDPAALSYIFRAVTPPGRSRRFDARFFLADATHLQGDPDDFSAACDELGHLHWIGLTAARGLDLPFITEVVLAEAAALIAGEAAQGVPFFDNSGPTSTFRRIV
jgi:8-oxo-dGTP pyrophosphatase MutT (NUDIX family)